MADKIIKCKINVQEINKKWLHVGKKGVYLNFTFLYNEEKDNYGNNGMLIQDVPTDTYKSELQKPVAERSRGSILGNGSVLVKEKDEKENTPGTEPGKQGASTDVDDLPF